MRTEEKTRDELLLHYWRAISSVDEASGTGTGTPASSISSTVSEEFICGGFRKAKSAPASCCCDSKRPVPI